MRTDKTKLIQLCVQAGALRFGEFTLKSGRRSPYFFNAGEFHGGALLGELAAHYAQCIAETFAAPFAESSAATSAPQFMLYGPAYKGIALCAGIAMQLAARHGIDAHYAFHRKEEKDHGEGGSLVGAPLRGDVIIVDDVITAGLSIGKSVRAIRAAGANPRAVVIALDRRERANGGGESAAQLAAREHGIEVHALLDLRDLVAYFREHAREHGALLAAMEEYRAKYGVDQSVTTPPHRVYAQAGLSARYAAGQTAHEPLHPDSAPADSRARRNQKRGKA